MTRLRAIRAPRAGIAIDRTAARRRRPRAIRIGRPVLGRVDHHRDDPLHPGGESQPRVRLCGPVRAWTTGPVRNRRVRKRHRWHPRHILALDGGCAGRCARCSVGGLSARASDGPAPRVEYLALATIAFGAGVEALLTVWISVTGGPDGLPGMCRRRACSGTLSCRAPRSSCGLPRSAPRCRFYSARG